VHLVFNESVKNELVDFRYRQSLSAGGPWASSSQAPAGSHRDTLFPLESPPFTTITH